MSEQQDRIGIVGWGSASPLGSTPGAVWSAYQDGNSRIAHLPSAQAWGAPLNQEESAALAELQARNKNYRRLDRSVLLAMLAAERLWASISWPTDSPTGLYLGSSRGATDSWENYFAAFQAEALLPPQASPLTTAGNLATHTAQHLGLEGFASDNSITCSSALHALANAIVWLESGRYQRFLAGGTEAPLTLFTLAQMKALKVYSEAAPGTPFPNRSLDLEKTQNTMILGEGSAIFALEKAPRHPLAWISGLGYAREHITSLTAVSKDGGALQQAMRMALTEAKLSRVDVVVCHCPGTQLGDLSEYQAIRAVFEKNMPSLTSNKWKIGHTLGASGGLSLELALLMVMKQQFVPVPYLNESNPHHGPIRTVMVNALGFGGNALSVIIEKPED